ncbi:serine/threonine protein kinase [Planktothrix agardhii NIES-204]|jgi:serine/threonine protein kinase|nr:serine/threonine-protein kinase [Planktothrix agardhii 1033]MCF3609266.1 serine/threonine-protein kinase [Planktothrix agardhii 1033]BBD56178.1 serine/threonine protein kinase [Planktothrix agardhii NIES-204]
MSQCLNPDCLQPNLKTTIFCQKCGSKLLLKERYRALKILEQGGFGRTFQAVDEYKLSQPYCVIKQFFPQAQGTNNQEKAEELFKREAIQLEQLGKHQQIPELFAYFIQDDRQYLVQEYIEGQNLAQELAKTGVFSETKIINLLVDLLPVLAFIHQKLVIHRDIKPENIIRRKSDNKLFLVDFGAAKAATITALAVTGTVIGSAQYTAPEQAMGKPTFASDLYSLGVTCIHLLTNIEPFDLFDVNESDWVWRDYLTVKVSDRLGQVLDKLLQQGTKKRFQTAQEVLDALQLTVKPTSIQTPQHDIALKSAKGVNYDQLEQLLKSGKWKEADQETAKKMLEVAGRTKEGCLDKNSIDNFPCEDLRTIDKLWVKYSSGRFGFSVQKNIWLEAGSKVDYETECKLGDRVGWRKNSSWMDYDDLAFSLQAPVGHLPVVVGVRAPVSWLAWFLGACAWVFVSFWVCFGVLVTFGFLFSLIWPDFTDMFIGLLGLVCVVGWGMVCWLGPLSDGWRSYRASRVGRSSLASRTAVSFNL